MRFHWNFLVTFNGYDTITNTQYILIHTHWDKTGFSDAFNVTTFHVTISIHTNTHQNCVSLQYTLVCIEGGCVGRLISKSYTTFNYDRLLAIEGVGGSGFHLPKMRAEIPSEQVGTSPCRSISFTSYVSGMPQVNKQQTTQAQDGETSDMSTLRTPRHSEDTHDNLLQSRPNKKTHLSSTIDSTPRTSYLVQFAQRFRPHNIVNYIQGARR